MFATEESLCSVGGKYSIAWYPVRRKSAWYTLMHFWLIKNGIAHICVKLPSQRTLRDYTHFIFTTLGLSDGGGLKVKLENCV